MDPVEDLRSLKLFSPSRLEIKCGQILHTNCLGRMIGTHCCLPVHAGQWRKHGEESTAQGRFGARHPAAWQRRL